MELKKILINRHLPNNLIYKVKKLIILYLELTI